MYSLGFDIGSSSIKASVLDVESGKVLAAGYYPKEEMIISSPKQGFAEQDPETWWEYAKLLLMKLIEENNVDGKKIKAIGISYQMHGLVLVDKNYKVLRPSIIWCDSRAVEIGSEAFFSLGEQFCLRNLLNSPGNFTASKLAWVKKNEPEIFSKVYKFMLPGDFIAMKLTGEISTTLSGLSEGIFWDFAKNKISDEILEHYGIPNSFVPYVHPTFSVQGRVTKSAAEELGISTDAVVSYRAGDQPNNAFSLNVLNAGEVAATAGTSGVVYGVIDQVNYDELSRVNPFAHLNHSQDKISLGVLLCINGTGIQNSWLRKNFASTLSYDEINQLASKISIGSDGVSVLPFGNGAERVLQNKNIGSQISGLDFNRHTPAHVFRAAQEGIVFSFKYGVDIMKEMGLNINVIRAGKGNMFLSEIFRNTLANITGASIELYETDGAQGAARGAAVGSGQYKSFNEAFASLKKLEIIQPNAKLISETESAYSNWLNNLEKALQ
ncbi:MAG: Xylulose kinase [Ignavibacteria bacterium]|nr:MAG: Xylulose kinase [Ignavibacteria bacterium]KAF0160873.1 MAG: Xylulose kinase [Ignavibacteria bacterium]